MSQENLSEAIFELPVIQQISSSISQRQLDELPVMVIKHPQVHAAVALQGAHLLAWHPLNTQPVLWLSPCSDFKTGMPIRGGIPICWPWFGPIQQPAHGFARNLPWKLTTHNEDSAGVSLTFTLQHSAASHHYWPNDFCLVARYQLGANCKIELESQGDYTFNNALHTYFNIGNIKQIAIEGLGSTFIDKVNQGIIREHHDPLLFSGRVDRIYTQPQATTVITDKQHHRTITLQHHQLGDVVVWNPWSEISISMHDMPDEGYKNMVCVETAKVNMPQKAQLTLPARLGVTLSVQPFNKIY